MQVFITKRARWLEYFDILLLMDPFDKTFVALLSLKSIFKCILKFGYQACIFDLVLFKFRDPFVEL